MRKEPRVFAPSCFVASVGVLSVCLACGEAGAQPVAFDNPLVGANGYGWGSYINTPDDLQQMADDVEVSMTTVIDSIAWSGFRGDGFSQAPMPGASFRVQVLADDPAGMSPGDVPIFDFDVGFVDGTPTGQFNDRGRSLFVYAVDLPDFTLEGGVPYWLSVVADTNWVWAHSLPAPRPDRTFFRKSLLPGEWVGVRDAGDGHPDERMDQAFTLFAVPAPGTAGVFVLGVCALGCRGRRVVG